jgi:hypothetical protein
MDFQAIESSNSTNDVGVMQVDLESNGVNNGLCSKSGISQVITILETSNEHQLIWNRISFTEAQTGNQENYDQAVAHSLVVAQRHTLDKLEKLEDEEFRLTSSAGFSVPHSVTPEPTPSARILRLPTGHKATRSIDSQIFRSSSTAVDPQNKRGSIWLGNIIFDSSSLPPEFRRQTWGDPTSVTFLEQQPMYLVQKWTEPSPSIDISEQATTFSPATQEYQVQHHPDGSRQDVESSPLRAENQHVTASSAFPSQVRRVEVDDTRTAIIRRHQDLRAQLQLVNRPTEMSLNSKQKTNRIDLLGQDHMTPVRQEQAYIKKIQASELKEIRLARMRHLKERQEEDLATCEIRDAALGG